MGRVAWRRGATAPGVSNWAPDVNGYDRVIWSDSGGGGDQLGVERRIRPGLQLRAGLAARTYLTG